MKKLTKKEIITIVVVILMCTTIALFLFLSGAEAENGPTLNEAELHSTMDGVVTYAYTDCLAYKTIKVRGAGDWKVCVDGFVSQGVGTFMLVEHWNSHKKFWDSLGYKARLKDNNETLYFSMGGNK